LTERETQACTEEPEERGTCGAATSAEPCIDAVTACKSVKPRRCRPAAEDEVREARVRRWRGGGRDSSARCRPVGRRTERGPTRASARPERDPSMGHAAAAKGPWRRTVAVLVMSARVELVQEQVAAAEESALERVADIRDLAAIVGARTPSRRGRRWCSRGRQ
jgi:hypothetical protein